MFKQISLTYNGRPIDLERMLIQFILKPTFILFIYFGMFSRFTGLPGLTGGMSAALLSGLFFVISCTHMLFLSRKMEVSQLTVFVTVFFAVLAVTPLVSSFVFNESVDQIARYFIELLVVFFIFFSFYYFIKSGLITPRFFIYTIAIIGAVSASQLLIGLIGADAIMRLRGLGGLNYIGNSLCVASICFIMILYVGHQTRIARIATIIGLCVVFLTMLLTGTRAATIAFVVALFLLQLTGMQSRNFKKYVLIVGLVLLIPITIIALNIDLSLLLRRYSFDNVGSMAAVRFDIYFRAVSDLSITEFLVGRPDLYLDEGVDQDIRYVNPHNAFLSLIRFNGLLSFLLFVGIVVVTFISYIRVYRSRKHIDVYRFTEASILVFLAISFINIMLSGGKITRNFYLYIALGYAAGYFDLLNSVKSPKEYLKMIFKF